MSNTEYWLTQENGFALVTEEGGNRVGTIGGAWWLRWDLAGMCLEVHALSAWTGDRTLPSLAACSLHRKSTTHEWQSTNRLTGSSKITAESTE